MQKAECRRQKAEGRHFELSDILPSDFRLRSGRGGLCSIASTQ
jgi:hypothetical protein